MLLHIRQCMCAMAVLLLAAPIWAARTDSAQFIASRPTVVGNTHLKPGNYTFRAEEAQNTLEVMQDGRVLAQVPCHWVTLSKKADSTEVNENGSQIVEVEFAGRTEAVQLQ